MADKPVTYNSAFSVPQMVTTLKSVITRLQKDCIFLGILALSILIFFDKKMEFAKMEIKLSDYIFLVELLFSFMFFIISVQIRKIFILLRQIDTEIKGVYNSEVGSGVANADVKSKINFLHQSTPATSLVLVDNFIVDLLVSGPKRLPNLHRLRGISIFLVGCYTAGLIRILFYDDYNLDWERWLIHAGIYLGTLACIVYNHFVKFWGQVKFFMEITSYRAAFTSYFKLSHAFNLLPGAEKYLTSNIGTSFFASVQGKIFEINRAQGTVMAQPEIETNVQNVKNALIPFFESKLQEFKEIESKFQKDLIAVNLPLNQMSIVDLKKMRVNLLTLTEKQCEKWQLQENIAIEIESISGIPEIFKEPIKAMIRGQIVGVWLYAGISNDLKKDFGLNDSAEFLKAQRQFTLDKKGYLDGASKAEKLSFVGVNE